MFSICGLGCADCNCGLSESDRCGTKSLKVDMRVGHSPVFQRRHEAFHHRSGAANVKVIRLERQLHAQQLHIDTSAVLIIASGNIFGKRIAEAEAQMEIRMFCRQRFQMRLHHQLAAIAHAVEQPDFTPGLFRQTPIQHAQHRRDANTSADHDYRRFAAVDMEMACRCADLQLAANRNMIMKEIG